MENIKDLRNALIEVFNSVKEGGMETNQAKTLVHVSSKIIQSTKLEMDYVKLIKSKRKIGFLEYNEKKK